MGHSAVARALRFTSDVWTRLDHRKGVCPALISGHPCLHKDQHPLGAVAPSPFVHPVDFEMDDLGHRILSFKRRL